MHTRSSTQDRIQDTINRIGQRVVADYTVDQIDEAISALTEAYANQFDAETYKPRVEVSHGREYEIKVYINLPKIGTFKPSFYITKGVKDVPYPMARN